MSGDDQTLVNFCLSKDLHLPFRFKLLNLSGLTRQLAERTYHYDADDVTSRIIRSKLDREHQLRHTLVTLVVIESGEGRPITCPTVCSVNYTIDSSTRLSPNKANSKWISLPIEYAKLPFDARLVLKFYNYNVKTGQRLFVGRSEMSLFDQPGNCTLNRGFQSLPINLVGNSLSTPLLNAPAAVITTSGAAAPAPSPSNSSSFEPEKLNKIEQLLREKEDDISANGNADRPWLDQISYRKIEQLNEVAQLQMRERLDGFAPADKRVGGPVYVNIELGRFEMPIVFSDVKYAELHITTSRSHPVNVSGANTNVSIGATAGNNSNVDDNDDQAGLDTTSYPARNQTDFNKITYDNSQDLKERPSSSVFDPDQYRSEISEDPLEYKFRKLERTHQLSPLDRDIKPTLKVRKELDRILKKQFFEKLTAKEKNLIWKFRFYLLNSLVVNGNNEQYNNFIINFIKCIDWDDQFEVNEFFTILKDIDSKSGDSDLFIQELTIVDCLELLSANYKNHLVRGMAIKRLQNASDEELEMFMVQLVQAIRNESFTGNNDNDMLQMGSSNYDDAVDEFEGSVSSGFQVVDKDEDPVLKFLYSSEAGTKRIPEFVSPLSDFIIGRAIKNPNLTNFFYWNLKIQVDDERTKNRQAESQPQVVTVVSNEPQDVEQYPARAVQTFTKKYHHLHIYERTLLTLISRLASPADSNNSDSIHILRRQVELVRQLHVITEKVKIDYRRETTARKAELLRKLLSEKHKQTALTAPVNESGSETLDSLESRRKSMGHHESLLNFPPLPIPLDPTKIVNGTIPEECAVYKSSLSPLKIQFKAHVPSHKYPIMYKVGDDLRQDQFIVQTITLMDQILRNENLDLKLIPYKILATGTVEGLLEFVENSSLSSILNKYNNSILAYLQAYNPDPDAPLGVKPDAMDAYVKSCAGYCVITYILGVGDRHLENLLLTKTGHFFHVDFGYILGADPKPFPPQMKLPIQVIEGMGGLEDENYQKFCNLCYITYLTLRRNASMILNLFQLMINTSIPALQTVDENNESEKMELIWKVQEKFMLDLNDEEAVLHFQRLIDDSLNAFYPVMIDRLHSMAQYWRS